MTDDARQQLEHAERAVRGASLKAIAVLGVALPLGYFVLPSLMHFPTALPERIAFAAHAAAVVMACVVVAVLMVSTGRRRSLQDLGGAAAGPPTPWLAVRIAFLQNTLEQAVLASVLYLALATLVGGRWLSLIVVAVMCFVVGRVLFWRGYPAGAPGRAFGMTLTMIPTVVGYLAVIVLLVLGF